MRDVAIVAFAQTRHTGHDTGLSETELILPVINEVKERTGLRRFGFTCSGSCDYLAGAPFSFVAALDALGAWPPISESHVEMDGAWALYEAWVRLQHGDVDSALVYGFGKSSLGDLRTIMTLQLDPYYLEPLGLDQLSVAALQAAALGADRAELDEIVRRSRADGRANPYALDLPAEIPDGFAVEPLKTCDIAPITDGAAAVVLAAGDLAARLCERPAHIRGIAHRTEPHYMGMRISPGRPPRPRPHEPRAPARARSRWPSCTRSSPTRSSSCAARWSSPATRSSTRPAARSPPTPSWPPASSASARPPGASTTAPPRAPSATPRAAPACSTTSSPSWRHDGPPLCGHRRRADALHDQAPRRVESPGWCVRPRCAPWRTPG